MERIFAKSTLRQYWEKHSDYERIDAKAGTPASDEADIVRLSLSPGLLINDYQLTGQ